MRTSSANEPLMVSTDGTAGPYIAVTTEQLQPVLQALHASQIPVQVDEGAVLLGGMPALAVINLGTGADITRVQEILDRVAAECVPRGKGRKAPVAGLQEVIVKGDPRDIQELSRRLEAGPPGGWSRRGDIEDRLQKTRTRGVSAYCFAKAIEPARREVAVWLQARGDRELYISSIIPLQGREAFGVEQHNEALADFQNTVIEPLVRGLRVRVFRHSGPVEPTQEEILSPKAMRLLGAFSATVKKGEVHPPDMRRWRAFIARTHLDNTVIGPSLLSSWLEDDGWSEEQRNQLVLEYESGRGLLSVYEEEQAAR